MKSDVTPKDKKEYPWIGENANFIVMFLSPETGVLLWARGPATVETSIGFYCTEWDELDFKYFKDTISLEN